jgi:VanZ family protein
MILIAVVLTAYMVILAALAVAAPGIGLAGTLVTFVPDGWQDWAHVPAYGLLGWLAIQGFRLRGWPLSYALVCGTLLVIVFGLWTEVAQGLAPGRDSSFEDLVHDAMGGMIAATLVFGQYIWTRDATDETVSPTVGFLRTKGVPSK